MRDSRRARSAWRLVAAVAVLALVAVACGGDDDDDGGAAEGGPVSILHAFTGETDTAGFNALADAFTEETGIEVDAQGTNDFEQLAVSRVEGGDPPDIIFHPQPGLLEDFVSDGAPVPLDDKVDVGAMEEQLVTGLTDIGSFDGSLYGLFARLSIKSLVFHPSPEFGDDGYSAPSTYSELLDLTDTIREDGTAPWCIGIESGSATGWVATDWIEDLFLRLHGPEAYDEWVTNDIKFDSPEMRAVITDYFDPIWLGEGNVFGGIPNITATSFGDAPLPMFDDPPNCYLHRQANFIQGFFPEESEFETDYNFFKLPAIEEGVGDPALIAGDLMALYTDNPNAVEFLEFAVSEDGQRAWAGEGGFLSVRSGFPTDAYPDDALAQQSELISASSAVRFDGSDLMPGAVGAGAFWTEMVAYVNGDQDLDTTLSNIDAAWEGGAD